MIENNFRRLIWLAALGIAGGGAAFVEACGGSSDDNLNDGSTDATQQSDTPASDAASDTGPVDAGSDAAPGMCPTYNGALALCNAEVQHCGLCGSTLTACQTANYTTLCTSLATDIFSQAYGNSIAACATVCDKDAAAACQRESIADASLTTQQLKTANDFCSKCSDASAACLAQVTPTLLELADPLAAAIDSKCTPDSGAACAAYPVCVVAVAGAAEKLADICDGG